MNQGFYYFWFGFFVVFFPDVGGSSLDSHHGFVVEYGLERDVELGRCLLGYSAVN